MLVLLVVYVTVIICYFHPMRWTIHITVIKSFLWVLFSVSFQDCNFTQHVVNSVTFETISEFILN